MERFPPKLRDTEYFGARTERQSLTRPMVYSMTLGGITNGEIGKGEVECSIHSGSTIFLNKDSYLAAGWI